MFLNIQIDLLILKTYDGQFTVTTKKSLHIIFKSLNDKQDVPTGVHACVTLAVRDESIDVGVLKRDDVTCRLHAATICHTYTQSHAAFQWPFYM